MRHRRNLLISGMWFSDRSHCSFLMWMVHFFQIMVIIWQKGNDRVYFTAICNNLKEKISRTKSENHGNLRKIVIKTWWNTPYFIVIQTYCQVSSKTWKIWKNSNPAHDIWLYKITWKQSQYLQRQQIYRPPLRCSNEKYFEWIARYRVQTKSVLILKKEKSYICAYTVFCPYSTLRNVARPECINSSNIAPVRIKRCVYGIFSFWPHWTWKEYVVIFIPFCPPA